jgi:GTPase SAR1 family protein
MVCRLTTLDELKVGNNPIVKCIPRDFLKTRNSLFKFLDDADKGSKAFSTVKLMFVGDGNVGKTSLLKALKQRRTSEKPGKSQPNVATDGIDITDIVMAECAPIFSLCLSLPLAVSFSPFGFAFGYLRFAQCCFAAPRTSSTTSPSPAGTLPAKTSTTSRISSSSRRRACTW